MRNYLAQIVESQQRFAEFGENPLFSIISTLLMVMIMIMNAFLATLVALHFTPVSE